MQAYEQLREQIALKFSVAHSEGIKVEFKLYTTLLETPPVDDIKQYYECLLFIKIKED